MTSQKTLYTKRNLVDQKDTKDWDYRHHFLMSWAWKSLECELGYKKKVHKSTSNLVVTLIYIHCFRLLFLI